MSRPSTKASIKSIFPTGLHDVTHRHDVQCSISLAEPCVFLTGFDFDGGGSNSPSPAAGLAVLRGTLQIRIVNSARVRAITLKLTPSGQINWPVGVTGALRSEFLGGDKFASQTLTLFNAVHDTLQTEYGNQVRYDLEETFEAQETINMRHSACNNSTRQLSLQIELHKPSNWNRNRGNSFSESKNAKVFPPGTYTYFFELPIGNSSIETVRVKYAWVKWNLEATVQRPGIFAPRVVCSTEVSVIRIPDPMSLRISEPIYMSRSLGDQIRVDCSISGKSFAIGSKIPISIRLTPLTKTRIEKVQVYVTEAVQYWVENKAEIRHDPTRKLLLYEKKPGRAAYTVGSSPSPSRTRRGQVTGVARKARASLPLEPTSPTPPIQNAIPNVPGDIDLGLENLCGPAELQYEIQIPTCSMMETNRALRLRPDCSWNRVDINHWIEVSNLRRFCQAFIMQILIFPDNGDADSYWRHFSRRTCHIRRQRYKHDDIVSDITA